MKIAIVMLSFNRINYTKKTIASFESQIGNKNNVDFFIYDNGSSDGTKEFLKTYNGPLRINPTFGKTNIGIANATKYLLKEKCFNKGYDFIVKVDDDEIFPNNWYEIFNFWENIEKNNCVFIGFKRKEIGINFYKNTIKHKTAQTDMIFGKFKGIKSLTSPGMQASTEKWWKEIFNDLTDFSALYGGWDYTFMEAMVRINKNFFVVTNFESIHFQKDEDYFEFSKFKKKEMLKFRRDHKLKWFKIQSQFDMLSESIKKLELIYPNHPKIKELKNKAKEIKSKLKRK